MPGSVLWAQDSREAELETIRGEIARLQSRLERARRQRRDVESELRATEIEIRLQGQRLQEAQAAQELSKFRIQESEDRIGALEGELGSAKALLKGRLLAMYQLGRPGYFRLVLSLKQRGELLPAIRALRYLSKKDGDTIGEFLDLQVELKVEREDLAREEKRVQLWVEQEDKRQLRLDQVKKRQQVLLAEVKREALNLEKRRVSLAEREKKLTQFLNFLYGQHSDNPLSGESITGFRGILDWPAKAKLKIRFGPRRDPQYGTTVPHNGITLTTTAGSPIRTVYPGKVLFAAPFQGWGPTVIVEHAGKVFTLYAGLKSLGVSQDDVLSLNQTLGRADDELYFEIRVDNIPQDPLPWLRNNP